MKKILLFSILSLILLSCNKTNSNENNANLDNPQIDSVSAINKVSKVTNLLNEQGTIIEIQKYPIGKFKRVNFEVWNIKSLSNQFERPYLYLFMRYESAYYYHTKSALVDQTEIPDFISFFNKINVSYLPIIPDVETFVAFISAGNVKLTANYNKGWKCSFAIDYKTAETEESFTKDDISTITALFNQSNEKIESLIKLSEKLN